jgi:dTMP kinase
MFITFEGLDFSGKSTQVAILKKYLEDLGRKILLIREPGGTEISEKIRDLLLDKENSEMNDKTELLLFYSSRSQLIREVIRPKLKEGYFVLSDRFHDSSTAYQGYGRGLNLDFIEKLNEFVLGETVPDITFFIDVPLDIIQKRKELKNGLVLDRIESSDDDFYTRVREGYYQISEKEDRFKIIDGSRNIEIIFEEIRSILVAHPKFRGKDE